MKTVVAVIALVVAAAFLGTSLVQAAQCPLLIKQLKEGVAKVSDSKTKADVERMISEAQQLHDEGKHAESVKKAEDAAKAAGITLQKKM
jgi:hypothetical protein